MNTPPDGGGYFHPTPQVLGSEGQWIPVTAYGDFGGITMRDWFAGQALVGILSKLPLIDQTGELGKPVPDKIKLNNDIADSCYGIADAMIKAREA